jgi:polysaccharide biosynthesis transport protein
MDSVNPQPPARDFFGNLGLKVYRYRAVIRRNWWILTLTIGIGVAYQSWVLYTKPQAFSSTSQVNIREELTLPENSATAKVSPTNESFLNTNLAMLKSPDILDRARQRVALESPQLAVAVPEIATSVIPRTTIFLITGTGPNPEYTQKYVDAVVAEFIEFRKDTLRKQMGDTSGFLTDSAARLKQELQQHTLALQAFQTKYNVAFYSEQLKQATEFLNSLKNKEAQLQTEMTRLENLTPDQLLTTPPSPARAAQNGATPGANAQGEANPEGGFNAELYTRYVETVQQLSLAQAKFDERSKVWKPKHPRLQALKAEVERLAGLLEVIRAQNREATEDRKAAIRAELKSLETNIDSWNQKVLEASGKDAEYKTLQKNVERTQGLLEKVLVGEGSIQSSRVQDVFTILQRASAPMEVPKGTLKHILMGLIGGSVVGIVILALLDRADDRLTSSSEIMDRFAEPILGQIPNVSDSRGESGLPLLQIEDDRYTFAEAFRSLRSSLIFMPNQGDLRTLIVTSAIPNEGKSTIASNLAITMAAAGARVVVVDADLRRGDLASLFDADGRTGLSNILRGEVAWESAIQQTKYPTLSLIPRGPVTNQSGELLLLPSVHSLLDALKSEFDLVIFNTAPILATDDTPTLAPHFDGSLMVLRAQFTPARLTQNALNALYQRQVNVLGLVLNCVDTEMPDYYYYRYPKYYAAK